MQYRGDRLVRYGGRANFAAWQTALGLSRELKLARFASQQIHHTLESRDAERELLPLALDQGVGTLIWSPLAGGYLTGKYRRGAASPGGARHAAASGASRDRISGGPTAGRRRVSGSRPSTKRSRSHGPRPRCRASCRSGGLGCNARPWPGIVVHNC